MITPGTAARRAIGIGPQRELQIRAAAAVTQVDAGDLGDPVEAVVERRPVQVESTQSHRWSSSSSQSWSPDSSAYSIAASDHTPHPSAGRYVRRPERGLPRAPWTAPRGSTDSDLRSRIGAAPSRPSSESASSSSPSRPRTRKAATHSRAGSGTSGTPRASATWRPSPISCSACSGQGLPVKSWTTTAPSP